MRRFKVAIFTGNYNHIRDGVSLTLNRLVAFLLKNNVEVLVFGPTVETPALKHEGDFIAVPSISMPGRPEYRITTSFPKNARQELENFEPDIVHIATPDILGLKALIWAKKRNIPVVSSYHTHFSSYLKYYRLSIFEPAMWKYLGWFYSKCLMIFVPSPSMAEMLKSKKIKNNLKIWERGIEKNKFSPDFRNEEWRAEKGFRQNDIVVTFVSRLVWEKNPELYADVITKLQEKFPDVKALIVGDGPAAEGLKEKIPDAVFTGFLKDKELATAYASSDIFFFPSDTETFGNVTLEAMASGLPCIVADATGSKSLVEHGVNGYLSPPDNPEEFYSSIEMLIVDKKKRAAMAKASFEKAKYFSWEVVNSKLLGYYIEVLEAEN